MITSMVAERSEPTRDSDRRALADLILMRASYLGERDRALIQQVYEHGVPVADIAVMLGVSRRTVQRRLAGLARRLTDRAVLTVLRHHGQWDEKTAGVAMSVWVRGQTLRDTAGRLGMSLHEVRKRVELARGLIMGLEGGGG